MKYTLQYDRRAMNFMIEAWGGANSILYENEQPGAVLGTYRGSGYRILSWIDLA